MFINIAKEHNIDISEIDPSLLDSFNRRQVTYANVNDIISICQKLNIENIKDFIVEHAIPSDVPYILNINHCRLYTLPTYMYSPLDCYSIINYDAVDWLKHVYIHHNDIYCKSDDLIAHAASTGSIQCMRFMHMNISEDNNQCWDKDVINTAASYGHIHCLVYAHKNGCEYDETIIDCAIEYDNVSCLSYIHEKMNLPKQSVAQAITLCGWAAEYDCLECLTYFHNNGYAWDETTCMHAAKNGNIRCLEYLHTHGCPWNKWTVMSASKSGHLECLKYAHENDKDSVMKSACVCEYAAINGHLDCLKYAHKNGYELESYMYDMSSDDACKEYIAEQQGYRGCYNLYSCVL